MSRDDYILLELDNSGYYGIEKETFKKTYKKFKFFFSFYYC